MGRTYIPEPEDFDVALKVIKRYQTGWGADKDGAGGLWWVRMNQRERMIGGEALIWSLASVTKEV